MKYYFQRLKDYIIFCCKIIFPFGKKDYLIGTPLHKNLGDSAIVISEMAFISKYSTRTRCLKEITLNEYENFWKMLRWIIHKDATIYLPGGGNMGDVWFHEEEVRRHIIKIFESQRIICFPQTISYTNTPKGQMEKKNSVAIYNNKSNLILVAREKISYDMMCELYPNTKVILTPDIVLSSTMKTYDAISQQRKGVLLCFRNDKEKILTSQELDTIKGVFLRLGYKIDNTDTCIADKITKSNRKEMVRKKLQEFSRYKLIITDRLHGMVFSFITRTPCIVFSNNNHKVKGTYQWIQDISYIRYVNEVEDVEMIAKELLRSEHDAHDVLDIEDKYKVLIDVLQE